MRRSSIRLAVLSLAFCLGPAGWAHADQIINGDFSQTTTDPSQPFEGWTTTIGVAPTDGGGYAVFTETDVSTELEQGFTLSASATVLSFDFKIASFDVSSGPFRDSFQATLYDSGYSNPYPTPADSAFPGFFSIDLNTGATPAYNPAYVSVTSLADGWSHVSLFDLSGVSDHDRILEFDLNPTGSEQTSVVYLRGVKVEEPPVSVVPEPATLGPCILAIACLGVLGGCRATARARSTRRRTNLSS